MNRFPSRPAFFFLLLLAGCGGGGAVPIDAGTPTVDPTPPPAPPTPLPAPSEPAAEASRFLSQAGFGGTRAEIDALATTSDYGAWIDAQRGLPVTAYGAAMETLLGRFDLQDRTVAQLREANIPFFTEEGEEPESIVDENMYARYAWWSTILHAPDQLRQRVAYALSQLLVVSDRVDPIGDAEIMTAYYEILQRHALGSFRTLIEDVTYSTAMGLYLTYMGNDKGDPAQGVFPDENYARELMQLFTIGLWELEPDGTRKLDANGAPIPTYDNRDITELARVFTGLGPNGGTVFRATEIEEHDFALPMAVWEAHHSQGPKRLIDGSTTNGNTAQDIDAALDVLVQHPNTAPFVSTFLIRRLTSSNPTPAYVARVANVFVNNGSGVRGDLGAVVRAILLDPEARDPRQRTSSSGKLREPVLRYVQLLRAFDARTPSNLYMVLGAKLQDKNDVAEEIEPAQVGQHPLSAPSVFNFYRNDFQPATLRTTSLVSPESQIINATTVSGYNALLRQVLFEKRPIDTMFNEELREEFPSFDFSAYEASLQGLDRYVARANDPAGLVRELNTVLAAGALSAASEQAIASALQDSRAASLAPADRVRYAIYLVMLSPAYLHRN